MDELKNGIHIHVDYLSFTFPIEVDEVDETASFDKYKIDIAELFFQDITAYGECRQYKQNGYENIISLGEHITIRFGGKTTMMKSINRDNGYERSEETYVSAQVELKGQGCREIEFLSGGSVDYSHIIDYFQLILNGRCTRIDICIDDKDVSIIKLDNIIDIVKKGHYTTLFKVGINPPKLNESLIVDKIYETSKGKSLYFGKSNGEHKSDRELCIYDKKAERNFRKDDYLGDYYVRYEIRFRNELADEVAFSFSKLLKENIYDIGYFMKNELLRILKLKIQKIDGHPTNSARISTWDIHPKWLKFLDYVEGVKFTTKNVVEPKIEIKKAWNVKNITKQEIIFDIADSFLPLSASSLDNWNDKVFKDIYEKLNNRLAWFSNHVITDRELAMINNYRRRTYGVCCPPLTMNDVTNYINQLSEKIKMLNDNFNSDLPF